MDSPQWRVSQDFVFRFWISPTRCLGFQYNSLLATDYVEDQERLSLEFPAGTVIIVGPQTALLHNLFCQENGRPTMVEANGTGIVSVMFMVREKKE